MKVQEIISEGIWDKALSLGAKLVSKSDKTQALEKLTALWAKEIGSSGKAMSNASTVIGKNLAKDKALLAAAKTQAEKLAAKATRAANAAKITGAISTGVKKGASGINKLLLIGLTADPFYEYNSRMSKWEDLLKAGKITQEDYDSIRQKELGTLVAHVAANLGGLAVFKSFGAGAKFLGGWIPGFRPLVTGLTTAGAAAMAYWWQTDEGRKWLSYAIVNEMYDLSPLIGGAAANLIDTVKSKIPGFNKTQPAATGGAGGQGAAQPGTTALTAPAAPVKQGPQPGALAGTNLQAVDTVGADGKPSFDITWKK